MDLIQYKKMELEQANIIKNKIMRLYACILFEPDRIPYTEFQKIAFSLFKRKNLGPKGTENLSLAMYKLSCEIWKFYLTTPDEVMLDKNGNPISLGIIISYYQDNGISKRKEYDFTKYAKYKSSFIEFGKLYEQIPGCISEQILIKYLKEEAKKVLQIAEEMITSGNAILIGERLGFSTHLEWLYNNLKSEVDRVSDIRASVIYDFTKQLCIEIKKNKLASEEINSRFSIADQSENSDCLEVKR